MLLEVIKGDCVVVIAAPVDVGEAALRLPLLAVGLAATVRAGIVAVGDCVTTDEGALDAATDFVLVLVTVAEIVEDGDGVGTAVGDAVGIVDGDDVEIADGVAN